MAAVGFAAGGVAYPTAYLLWWVGVSGGDGEVALAVMVLVSACCCWVLVDSALARARRRPGEVGRSSG